MLGGQLSIPHPSRQSEPGQTKMKQRCVLQNTVQQHRGHPTQAQGSGRGSQPTPAAQGGKAAGAHGGKPTSTKNAILAINNFPASGGNCTPHPFWAAFLSLETVFLGT